MTSTERPMDDRALARSAAGGDAAAFEVLVRRHVDSVWRMAWSLTRDDFRAEEIVQDTFLEAHRDLGTGRGEAEFGPWLLSICHRTCSNRSTPGSAEETAVDGACGRRRSHDRTDLRGAMERALERLAAPEREAFDLVEVIGLTRDDAADVVGVRAAVMRRRVSRSRRKLVRALGDARRRATGD